MLDYFDSYGNTFTVGRFDSSEKPFGLVVEHDGKTNCRLSGAIFRTEADARLALARYAAKHGFEPILAEMNSVA